jgi:hypothetical protein
MCRWNYYIASLGDDFDCCCGLLPTRLLFHPLFSFSFFSKNFLTNLQVNVFTHNDLMIIYAIVVIYWMLFLSPRASLLCSLLKKKTRARNEI